MAVYLTPVDVDRLCSVTVTEEIIAAAAQVCETETGYTFTEHNTARSIPEAQVKQAWALVSVNVARWFTAADDDTQVVSESQGDYSVTVDQAARVRADNASPIDPKVRRLLNLPMGRWGRLTPAGFTSSGERGWL